jgi:hypothetical protein
MNKFMFSLGAVIALTAILVIPSAPTHIAKASTCGGSANSHGNTHSFSSTESGSCASNGEATGGPNHFVSAGNKGGHTSSCNSVSVSSTVSGSDLDKKSSSGSVSCSTHKP